MDPEVDESEAEIASIEHRCFKGLARVKLSALKFEPTVTASCPPTSLRDSIRYSLSKDAYDSTTKTSLVQSSPAMPSGTLLRNRTLSRSPFASKTTARSHSSALLALIAFMGYIAWPPREATWMKTINGGQSDSTPMVRYKISIIIQHSEVFRFVRGRVSKAHRGIREYAMLFGRRDLLEDPFL